MNSKSMSRLKRPVFIRGWQVLFSYMIGVFVLQEIPNLMGTVGALLIAFAASLVMREQANRVQKVDDSVLDDRDTSGRKK